MLRNIGEVPPNVEQHWRKTMKCSKNNRINKRKKLEINWNDKEPAMENNWSRAHIQSSLRAEMWRNIKTMSPNVVPHWGFGGGVGFILFVDQYRVPPL